MAYHTRAQSTLPKVPIVNKGQILDAYGELPMSFIENAGQANPSVKYYARSSNCGIYFAKDEAVVSLIKETKPVRGVALALKFLGASPGVKLEGQREGTAKINYLVGNNPTAWKTGLPTHEEILYKDRWTGIDAVFKGDRGQLKYEFILKPGASINDIKLVYHGADSLSLDKMGNLLIKTPLGVLTDEKPTSYQLINGKKVPVKSGFVLERQDGRNAFGFTVEGYDPRYPLIVDPSLTYSTFLGGTAGDSGIAVAIDAAGNAYVTGATQSLDFPVTPGAFDRTHNGGAEGGDVFVAKLNTEGTRLVYATYLGGSEGELGRRIAVDAAGNAYVAGATSSTNFPTTPGAFDRTHNGGDEAGSDAFVAKLDATGANLLYGTFLGGSGDESGNNLAIDIPGNAYITGSTASTNFPTISALDSSLNGGADVFVTKLNTAGSRLLYSTYLGGGGNDFGLGIAVDSNRNAYVVGGTASANFPTTTGSFDTSFNGVEDVFVTKLDPTGTSFAYSTFLGGSVEDSGVDIAADPNGNAYVVGFTFSIDFPTTPGSFDTSFNGTGGALGEGDAFVVKLDTRTLQQQVQQLINQVQTLVTAGTLTPAQGNVLIARLQSATAQLNQGNADAAISELSWIYRSG